MGNDEYYPLDYLTSNLGFTKKLDDNRIVLKRDYELKRLITQKKLETNKLNIVSENKIGNIFFYDFETEYDVKVLQESLNNDGIETAVDRFVSLSNEGAWSNHDIVTKKNEFEDKGVFGSSSFNSWGGNAMKFDDYLSALKEYESKRNMVAVIDSGINYYHDQFENCFNARYSKAFCDGYDSDEFLDDDGHGTHVAGTIAELTGGNSDLIAIKVLNHEGSGSLSMIYAALEYLLDLKESNVPIASANISIGARVDDLAVWTNSFLYAEFSEVIKKLKSENVIICASAGNNSEDTKYQALASVKDAVVVSAIDNNKNLTNFSNYGEFVTFCAPGYNIMSADYSKENGYCSMSGTSMSTPHVTAVVALVALICDGYTFDDIIAIMKLSSDDLGEVGKDDVFGYGCVNMNKATDFIIENIFGEDSLSAIDNLGNEVTNKSITIKYINQDFDYKVINYEEITSLNGKLYYGKLKIEVSVEDNFLAWRGSKSDDFSKSFYLGDENSIWFSPNEKIKCLYMVFDIDFIKAKINYIYVDKAEYVGFASYANTTILNYVNTSGINIRDEEHVSSYLSKDQIIHVEYAKVYGLKLYFKCDNDSVIDKIVIRKKYNKDIYEEEKISIIYGEYDLEFNDFCLSVNIDVFIFI